MSDRARNRRRDQAERRTLSSSSRFFAHGLIAERVGRAEGGRSPERRDRWSRSAAPGQERARSRWLVSGKTERRVAVSVVGAGSGATAIEVPVDHDPNAITSVGQGSRHRQPLPGPGYSRTGLLFVEMSNLTKPDGGHQVRHRRNAIDDAHEDPQPGFLPVNAARIPDHQHGQRARAVQPEPPIRAVSGTARAGPTCRTTTAMIAKATGHQCSPRSAAGTSTAGEMGGFCSVAILHDARHSRCQPAVPAVPCRIYARDRRVRGSSPGGPTTCAPPPTLPGI